MQKKIHFSLPTGKGKNWGNWWSPWSFFCLFDQRREICRFYRLRFSCLPSLPRFSFFVERNENKERPQINGFPPPPPLFPDILGKNFILFYLQFRIDVFGPQKREMGAKKHKMRQELGIKDLILLLWNPLPSFVCMQGSHDRYIFLHHHHHLIISIFFPNWNLGRTYMGGRGLDSVRKLRVTLFIHEKEHTWSHIQVYFLSKYAQI